MVYDADFWNFLFLGEDGSLHEYINFVNVLWLYVRDLYAFWYICYI